MNKEGRCITIARVRAGMTSAELARRLYYSSVLIKYWEYGTRTPPWEQLYAILPELPKIREAGCDKYCPKADICLKTGKCTIATSAKSTLKNRNVVEVVRCENCRKGAVAEVYGKEVVRCPYMERLMDLDGYCSFGEGGDDHG